MSNPQHTLDDPLKKCTKCQSQRYCSRDCQTTDWPRHKLICEGCPPDPPEPDMRGRLQFGMDTLAAQDSHDDAETIYYLKISQAHIHDTTITGPYYPIGMVRESILAKFQRTSFACFDTFSDAFPDDIEGEGPIRLAQWTRIAGPLNDSPRHQIQIHLLSEHSPILAAKLPGPAYRLMFMQMKDLAGTKTDKFARIYGYAPLDAMEVHGSFVDKSEAEAAARKLLKDKIRGEFPSCKETVLGWREESFTAAITEKGATSKPGIRAMVQVTYDRGQLTY